jgi:hypothetical protein
MRTGEAVIDNSGWAERILPPAIVGIVVFLFTRLYDSWQFEKKLNELIEKHLRDFNENKVAPLRERVSKFDRTVEDLQHDIAEVKVLTARIAEKLEVKAK